MELLKGIRSDKNEIEHWVAIDSSYTPPDLLPLDNFRQKLGRILNELGRVDYSLQEALGGLSSDLTDTHDRLYAQITDLSEPDLNKTMTELADAITRTMGLVDGVLADNGLRKQ
jgi:hypothetical protein